MSYFTVERTLKIKELQEAQCALMFSPDNILDTITKWFMRRIFLNKPI